MLNAWVQKADFSSQTECKDVSCEQILRLWNSLDFAEFDAMQESLEKSKAEFCPWGVGIGHGTDKAIHIYRDSVERNTFCALIEQRVNRKILGFIPIKSVKSEYIKGITCDQVPSYIKNYFACVEN